MSDRSGIIRYRDRDIVYADYSGLANADDLKRRIKKVEKIEKNTGRSGLLELVDVTGSFADPELLELLEESARRTSGVLGKVAVIGISEVKKVFLEVVKDLSGIRAEPKETMEEAKEWLVRD